MNTYSSNKPTWIDDNIMLDDDDLLQLPDMDTDIDFDENWNKNNYNESMSSTACTALQFNDSLKTNDNNEKNANEFINEIIPIIPQMNINSEQNMTYTLSFRNDIQYIKNIEFDCMNTIIVIDDYFDYLKNNISELNNAIKKIINQTFLNYLITTYQNCMRLMKYIEKNLINVNKYFGEFNEFNDYLNKFYFHDKPLHPIIIMIRGNINICHMHYHNYMQSYKILHEYFKAICDMLSKFGSTH